MLSSKRNVCRAQNVYDYQAEYNAWLIEVKDMNPEGMGQGAMKEEFRGFMEDFNTATMPHVKSALHQTSLTVAATLDAGHWLLIAAHRPSCPCNPPPAFSPAC